MKGVAKQECDFLRPFSLAGVNLPNWEELPAFNGSDKIEITIGCSNWNRDGSIEACIVSMCDQSFPKENYEIILVDDKSEDNSRDIIKKTIARFPEHNIIYYALEESRTKNEHHPHNVTIRKARGNIFIKNSGDNIFSYHYLEAVWRQHQRMDNLFLTTFWGKPKWDIFTLKTVSDKLLDRKYRQEDYLKDVLNHGLSEKAGENGDVVDTGGSIKTKYLKDMRGFNEDICGNTPGDVELMCRLNFSGIVFGYAKNVFSIHYHLGSSDVKRGIIESHDVKWEPQVAIRNRDGYGELTEAEENSRIKYAKNS